MTRNLLRRLVLAVTLAALAVTITSPVVAAQPKVPICHYDRDAGTYSIILVAAKANHPKGNDYAPDTALAGRTLYAIAYTNVNGVDGYQADGCDVFISALAENNGNAVPDAGDQILIGRGPTAWDAPWGFAAYPGTSAPVGSVVCDSIEIVALPGPGAGGIFWERLGTAWESTRSNIAEGFFSFFDYNTASADDSRSAGSSVFQRNDPGDDPFLDVDLLYTC